MSLNNIELGDLIVSELYRNSLLATEASAPTAPTRPVPAPETNAPVNPAGRTSSIPVAPATRPSSTPGADGSYKFLGNNRRQITVLVQSPGVAFLPDDQLSFLTRMLEACRMNIGDVAIINLANAPVTITALKQQLQPNVILLFGMEPVAIRLPMNFPWFKIQAYDECTYLCAPSLEELVLPGDESKLLKSKLWMCLKTLFEI